jgi:hypothetical protein
LEEASRIEPMILEEVIAPMLKMKDSVLIALSTNLGRDNYYSKLFEKTGPPYDELFLKVHVDLMCDDCKAKKKLPTECNCNDYRHPHWNIAANKERAQILMSSEQMYAQEVLGTVMSNRSCIYDSDWLKRFRTRVKSIDHIDDLTVHTFIDPSGGGTHSSCGICSIVRDNDGTVIVVGLASLDTKDTTDIATLMLNYFHSFTRDPVLRGAQHIMYIENNYGGSSYADLFHTCAKQVLPNIKEWNVMSGKDDGKHGVTTTREAKNSTVMSSIWMLYKDEVSFCNRMCTDKPKHMMETICNFLNQFENVHKKVRASGKWEYTGKTNRGEQDDMWMAFIMSCYWSLFAASTLKYIEARAYVTAALELGVYR